MKILLAIDESKFSEAATKTVIEQTKPRDSEVHILHVIEVHSPQLPEMMASYPGAEHGRDSQRVLAEALLAKTAKLLRSKGLQVTTSFELGNPKSKIIDVASKWDADLIVVGSHGRNGLERFLLGSVSDTVARHAKCSVEIVRIPSRQSGGVRVPRK